MKGALELEIELHVSVASLPAFAGELLRLPERLRPMLAGPTELRRDASEIRSDAELVNAVRERFFLFSERVSYSSLGHDRLPYRRIIARRRRGPTLTQADIEGVFRAGAGAELRFGAAYTRGEHERRNYLVRQTLGVGVGTTSGWIGVEGTKELPGLYWVTAVPPDRAAALEAAGLRPPEGCERLDVAPPLVVWRFFPAAKDWEAHADRLDELCERTAGVFSMRRALRETPLGDPASFEAYIAFVRAWP